MKNREKQIINSGMLIILFFLSACQLERQTVLEDQSCAPPCWNLITPGVTKKSDVLLILPTLPEVNEKSIKESPGLGGINESIIWSSGDSGGRIYFDNNEEVSLIVFYVEGNGITLGDAVEKLGTPEQQISLIDSTEIYRRIIYIFYPSKGYALLSERKISAEAARSEQAYSFSEKDPLGTINYFEPVSFKEVMTNGTVGTFTPQEFERLLQPWTGFGED